VATKKNEAYVEFKANTADFNKGIKDMNAELKNAANALRLNSTQLKGAGDSVDLLSERQDILQNELEASKTKVELTERSLAECKATLGENSKEYQNLNNAVIAAKNQQAAIQNELDQTIAKLDKITEENKEAATSFGKLANEIEGQEGDLAALKKEYAELVLTQGKNSKEAKALAKQISSLSGDIVDNKKKMNDAEGAADKLDKSLRDLGDGAEDAGDGFTIAKGAIADFIGNGLSSLASGLGNAVTGLAGLAEETREYRTEMAKLDAAFSMTGHNAEAAEATYRELQSVLGDEGQATEASVHLAQLCKDEEQLATMTEALTGVYGMFGASLPLEGLAEAANESAKVGQVTGSLADALNWASIPAERWSGIMSENSKAQKAFNGAIKDGENIEDAFTAALQACSTEQERAALITDALSGAYQEEAWAFQDANKSVIEANKAQADYTDTMAAFGEKVEPITTTVKNGFNGLLQEVLGLTEGADIEGFSSSIQSAFATVKDEVLPAVVEGFGKLKEAWQWLSEHTGLLTTVAVTIGIITTAITLYNGVQAIKTAMDAAQVTTVWALVAAHAAQAAAAMAAIAPYVLVVAAIAAVIAIIVLCVKHWDTIKEKITEVAQKVKEKVTDIKNQITEKITAAKDKALSVVENLKSGFTSKVEAIKSKVTSVFNSIKDKIMTPINTARDKVKAAVDKIKSFFDFKIKLPEIKTPSVKVTWKTDGALAEAAQYIGLKGIPKFSIKWNALGGFFNKPTVLQGLGEAGPEYALPLNERSLAPLAVMLNKLTMTGSNGLADLLTSRFDAAIDKLADRLERLEFALYLDSERVATATAPHNDTKSAERALLVERGLALE
jgi:phage-related protein